MAKASAGSPRVRAIAPAISAGSRVGTTIGKPRANSKSSSARLSGWWGSAGESAFTQTLVSIVNTQSPPHLADGLGEGGGTADGGGGEALAERAVAAPCRSGIGLGRRLR